MKNLTAANAAKTLASAYPPGTLVDSHQFQRDSMANSHLRTAFALDFLDYIENADPLHAFSLAFGAWIKNDWSHLVAPTGLKVVSANLRNNNSPCEQWRVI